MLLYFYCYILLYGRNSPFLVWTEFASVLTLFARVGSGPWVTLFGLVGIAPDSVANSFYTFVARPFDIDLGRRFDTEGQTSFLSPWPPHSLGMSAGPLGGARRGGRPAGVAVEW